MKFLATLALGLIALSQIATAERPEDIQVVAPAVARDTVKPVKWAAFGFQPPTKREAPG
ncbi:UNVERIFIED_CONTAM: hypothetical protein HDU68_007113, partial [Siphonaria sp. JEL0065]